MKKIRIHIILMVLFGSLAIASCNNSGSKSAKHEYNQADAKEYICSMHPEVITDKPGDCPKCGMALVEKNVSEKTEQEHKHEHNH